MSLEESNPRKIAIVGANGRLGRACVKAARAAGHEVIKFNRDDCDLSWSDDQIRDAIAEKSFDALIMAAALTNVDGCERNPEDAEQANVDAPRVIAALCAERGVRMVHISTDYVFDGKKTTPYLESDAPNPLSVYGQSKLDGEKAVLEASDDHLVIRVSWLFGDGPKLESTPDWAVKLATELEQLNIVTDKIGSPTDSDDAAELIIDLLFLPEANGILHLNGSESCTWQEWAQFAIDQAVEQGVTVTTRTLGEAKLEDMFEAKGKAPRPQYSVLCNERLKQLTGKTPRGWRETTAEYVREHVAPRFL